MPSSASSHFTYLACACALALAGCTGSNSNSISTGESASDGSTTSESDGTTTDGTTTDDTDTGGTDTDDTSPPPEQLSLTLLDEVTFYDGYAAIVDEPVPEGVIRHSNALYAAKLGGDDLAAIQNTLDMRVYIGALCDNYDRLGAVFLSLVPKGAETYDPAEVSRFEIARFITPFMDKNKQPNVVPFDFEIDNIVPILKDEALTADYDFWFELSVFGVPYTANKEIAGCEGRNDVFLGTLVLNSDSETAAESFDFAILLATNEAFNNYQVNATDKYGQTRKTIKFTLDTDTTATQLVLITSNHGANPGGEEYNRREHYVSIDKELVLQYKPGRESCEPFRMYNTQDNGIYGPSPKSDAEWQSFSNWCPGDVIDTRIIDLGPMTSAIHKFEIKVPDAEFVGEEGNIPFSLYLQGR